jgi:hypothetical protein
MDDKSSSRRKRALLRVPSHHLARLPSSDISVSKFLELPLPCFANCNLPRDHVYFSHSKPSNMSEMTELHFIPPTDYTLSLLNVLEKALVDGFQSVIHPGASSILLPFWVLSYWAQMGHAIIAQAAWQKAFDWVYGHATSTHDLFRIADEALQSFDSLIWNAPLRGAARGIGLLDLAGFLSTDLVKGGIVDSMMDSISERVNDTPHLRGKVLVQDLSASEYLRYDHRWSQYDFESSFCHLRGIGDCLADQTVDLVIFPFNLGQSHWAVFFVDRRSEQIKFGEGLGWSWPREDVDRIQRWLSSHGLRPYSKGGNIESGTQLDGYSCAVVMSNIIQNSLFGEPIFTDKDKHYLRIREYLNIVKSHFSQVCHTVMYPFTQSL